MPQRFTERIIRLVKRADYKPMKLRQAAQALQVDSADIQIFQEAIELLYEQRRLVINSRGQLQLPEMPQTLQGLYRANTKGYGFVRPERAVAGGDLFIPPGQAMDAVSGDTVLVQVQRRGRQKESLRYLGHIRKILQRGQTQIVGTLKKEAGQWFVSPDGRGLTEKIAVEDPKAKNAVTGDKVLVEIIDYPKQDDYANGVILEKLGKSGSQKTELQAVLRRYQIDSEFTTAAIQDARRAAREYDPQQCLSRKGRAAREDIRNELIITIDPEDARDFDDAVSLSRPPEGGWLLGVHIADVSHFIPEDSALDQQARQRATSVYLPGHVVPMLPELLSNGVCSLQQGKPRLVKSAYIQLDMQGNVQGTRFANSMIRSARRFTYEQIDQVFQGQTQDLSPKLVDLIGDMKQLAEILQTRRQNQGMISLDMPSAELVYDSKGRIVDAKPESTTFSHTMIEMFMLEANEAVARRLDQIQVPFLRRIHPEPDGLAMNETTRVIRLCGYTIPRNLDRKGMQLLLKSARGKPESFLINLAILRSMQRAEYSPSPMGHFALASRHYGHFTSPIRRYPDLTVHRLLQAWLEGRLRPETVEDYDCYEELEELGQHCSQREHNAEDAERDLKNYYLLRILEKKVGQEASAVVTSVTNFGCFLQMEQYLVEGLISAEDVLKFQASQEKAGKKQGRRGTFRQSKTAKGKPAPANKGKFIDNCPLSLGQELRVRIAAVNLMARTLDLVPIRKITTHSA